MAPALDAAALSAGAAAMERGAAAVERLRDADREAARVAAVRLERIHELRVEADAVNAALPEDARDRVRFSASPDMQRRSVRAEVAAVLRISERAAETQLEFATALVTDLTATLDALRCGDISERHARLIWEHACSLPAEDGGLFEEQALTAAQKLSPARLVGKLREIAERLHPDTVTVRHRKAVEGRDVWVDPCADGTAILSIRHSVEQILATQQLIEQHALGVTGDPAETRTLAQVRADSALQFLLNADLGTTRIVPTVHLTVPALSVAGFSDELAILDGYGPIDLDTASTLLANAPLWIRVVTHPVTGTVLATDNYRPTAELRRWLRLRDQMCRAPGCGRRAIYCEIDHTKERAADNGPTSAENLATLCVNHHKLKTLTGWSYRHLDGTGTLEWTSPLGQTYITEPAIRTRGEPVFDAAVERIAQDFEDPPPPPEPGPDPNPDWVPDPERYLDPDGYLYVDDPADLDRRSEIPDDVWFELMTQMAAETDYDLTRELLREDTERFNE